MIAIAKQNCFPKSVPAWHAVFLAMLPAIVTHAKIAFRHLNPEARQDAVQEAVANALVAFVGLVRRGKMETRCCRAVIGRRQSDGPDTWRPHGNPDIF